MNGAPAQPLAPVACVIPALDAARTVAGVVRGLRAALPRATVIVVDDGSRDDTAAEAGTVADAVVRFERNRGKGAALRAGFDAALRGGAAVLLTVDADGQHDPSRAPLLLDALGGADVAIGARPRRGSGMPLRRRMTNGMASAAVGRIIGARVADSQSGYRAIRREVVERVTAGGDRYEFETEFLIRAGLAGFRIAAVPVPTLYGAPSHFRGLGDSIRIVRTIWRYRAGTLD